jgi:hypothetical protein
MDIDNILANTVDPKYPTACTAIGFCMGMKLDVVRALDGFDEIYGKGYGEDTDLHYKVLEAGYGSVVVDNLYVFHLGKGTFNQHPENDCEIVNRTIFERRWLPTHIEYVKQDKNNKSISHVIDTRTQSLHRRDIDSAPSVIVLYSAINAFFGGTQVLNDIVSGLINEGQRVIIASVYQAEPIAIYDLGAASIGHYKKIYECVKSAPIIIASAHNTYEAATELASAYNSKVFYFVQGAEMYFDAGSHYAKTAKEYSEAQNIITCSDFLSDMLRHYSPDASIKTAPIGPNPLIYYPRDVKRENQSLAIHVRYDPSKGSCYTMHLAYLAHKKGFKCYAFGYGAENAKLPYWLENLGMLDRNKVASLFSRVGFYADLSVCEGLGLMPYEAAYCGAIPMLFNNGGGEKLLETGAAFELYRHHRSCEEAVEFMEGMVDYTGLVSPAVMQIKSQYGPKRTVDFFRKELELPTPSYLL